MKCDKCNNEIDINMKFCPYCGHMTVQNCPHCGTICKPEYLFCIECGMKLSSAIPFNLIPTTAIKKEALRLSNTNNHNHEGDIRKHATVLFADVRGSTELIEGLDPEEARNIILPVVEAMCEAVYGFGGTIIKTAGDGIVAIFGAPLAVEDHALRACLAALSMQATVIKTNDSLKIRVGIHSGEVYLEVIGDEAHRGYDIVGQTVNLAARMEQTATPGTIQITSSTLNLVEHRVQVIPIGAVDVKGFSQPIEVYELQSAVLRSKIISEVGERQTFLPFMGRHTEMELLNQLADQAASGNGNVVGIIANAGQGKTRLMYEFILQGARAKKFDVLITGGFSHTHNTPYFPLVHLLQGWMGVLPDETEENAYQKIQPFLTDVTTPHAIDALMVLLGFQSHNTEWNELEHALKRKYQFETIMAVLFATAAKKPLVFVIEDLYWIDNETEAFLNILLSHINQSRMLLIVTSRSEYVDDWVNKPHYTQIKLDAIPQNDETTALNKLLGNHPSLQKIKTQLLQNCAGNPFFLEEMIKSLIHDKVLIGSAHNYQLSENALTHKIQLPESIFAVLQTQLDSLPPLERKILRMASVIGERFTYKMLSKIMEKESLENIQKGLCELTANEYIFQTHIYPEPESAFKHALIHEVTYNSILKSLRRSTHVKILAILESLLIKDQNFQLQAYHAYQGESWEKAFYYCQHAAEDMFFLLSANQSAAILFEKALASAEHLQKTNEILEKCLRMHMHLIAIYRRLCRLNDEGRHIKETEDLLLLTKHKEHTLKPLFYTAMGSYYLSLGETRKSMQWYNESAIANVLCEDRMMQAVSAACCVFIYLFVGQYATLYNKADKALQMLPALNYRHELFPLPMGHFTNWLTALAHAYTGDYHPKENFEEKVQYLMDSVDVYRSSLDAVYISMAIGWLYFYQGLYENAIDHLSRALIFANELEILQYIPAIAAALACANLRLNKSEEGKQLTDHALAVFHSYESYLPKFLALDLITEALILFKDYTAAKVFGQQAIQITERCELQGIKTTMLRLMAEIDLNLPHPDYKKINQLLQESIENGEKLGMVSNMGHCQLVLAKMHEQMGNSAAAENAQLLAKQCYEKLNIKMIEL